MEKFWLRAGVRECVIIKNSTVACGDRNDLPILSGNISTFKYNNIRTVVKYKVLKKS